jgi:hypothetical protein
MLRLAGWRHQYSRSFRRYGTLSGRRSNKKPHSLYSLPLLIEVKASGVVFNHHVWTPPFPSGPAAVVAFEDQMPLVVLYCSSRSTNHAVIIRFVRRDQSCDLTPSPVRIHRSPGVGVALKARSDVHMSTWSNLEYYRTTGTVVVGMDASCMASLHQCSHPRHSLRSYQKFHTVYIRCMRVLCLKIYSVTVVWSGGKTNTEHHPDQHELFRVNGPRVVY